MPSHGRPPWSANAVSEDLAAYSEKADLCTDRLISSVSKRFGLARDHDVLGSTGHRSEM